MTLSCECDVERNGVLVRSVGERKTKLLQVYRHMDTNKLQFVLKFNIGDQAEIIRFEQKQIAKCFA